MEIIIVGLGPAGLNLITLETWQYLTTAPTLMLRTARHPAAAELADRNITYDSYDQLYEQYDCFEAVYAAIAADVVKRARNSCVTYAVPGSPFVAEQTVPLIQQQAATAGIKVTILAAMSFLDVLYTRLGIDPQAGLTISDAGDCDTLLAADTALVVTQLYNRQVASELKLTLMERLADEQPVTLCRRLGLADEAVITLPLYELDRQSDIDHLTTLYVPPVKRRLQPDLTPLVQVMARLRSPDGCVWDLEQTHTSLRRYLVEEAYEVLEAIDEADPTKLCEELGDLLLQIVFHARIAEENTTFSLQDVITAVSEKMIRRHPHVFGNTKVNTAAEVVTNWEEIKRREPGHNRKSALDGVPPGLPSLMAADKLQTKAAKVGFDWPDPAPVWDKVQEELAEFADAVAAGQAPELELELGDVLFSIVNLARKYKLDPELALSAANRKFYRRFTYIENYLAQHGQNWQEYDLEQLDKLWAAAKSQEVL